MAGAGTEEFVVVVNAEDQYAIWPGSKAIPPGWEPTGVRGARQDCVAHVNAVWTDMRPRSLRAFLEGRP